jgi:hypothetical protein
VQPGGFMSAAAGQMTLNVSQLNQIGGLLQEVNPDGSANNAATQQLLAQVLQQLGGNFTQTTVSDDLHTHFVAAGGFGITQLAAIVAAIAASIVTAGAAAAAMGATMATLTFGESVVVGMASAMAGSLASQVVSGNGINFGAVLEAGAIGALTAGIANGITYNPTSGLGFNGLGQSLGAMPAQTSTLGQLAGLSNLTNVLVPGASTAVGSLPQMALAMTAMATLDAGVQTAIGGGSFLNNLKNGAVADVAAAGAYAIGDEAKALTAGLGQVGGELAYTGLHAVLGCAASAAEGTGCAGGAIGGAASAALTPFVANAVTGGDPNITPGQAAAIAGIATLTGGVFAGLAGQNAMAGATAAENEALNNCMGHPETCLQMAKNALNSAGETASNVWTGITNPQPSPNSGFTSAFASAMNAGTDVPGMESATNLDLLKGAGNVALNLPSLSLPGMRDYTPYFQYNNPVVGSIGEMYGVLGMNSLVAGAVSSNTAISTGTTAQTGARASASSYVPTAGDVDLPNVYTAQVQGLATNSELVPFSLPNGTTIEGVAANPLLAPAAPTQRYQITPAQTAQYLQQMGLPQSQIDSFVNSFQGPIYVRNALPGETFGAYSGGPGNPASGQFLTPGTAGQTPGQVTNTLALPPSNPATTLNAATINRPIPVLEGLVAPQNWNGAQAGGGWQVFVPGGARYGANPPVTIGPQLN